MSFSISKNKYQKEDTENIKIERGQKEVKFNIKKYLVEYMKSKWSENIYNII